MMLMHKAMADGDMAQVAAYEAILADEDALISLGESALAEAGAQA
jgi:hypothetical protein